MSENCKDVYHPMVVEAFAEAWASIDGKLAQFTREKANPELSSEHAGTYLGYMIEAQELLRRAGKRVKFDLWETLGSAADAALSTNEGR